MNWQKVDKCKVCGRISKQQKFCKCGTELRIRNNLLALFTEFCMEATDDCEVVIARKRWFKWVEREKKNGVEAGPLIYDEISDLEGYHGESTDQEES